MHIGHELADPFGTDPNDVNLEVLQQQVLDDLENYVLKWQALPPPPPPPPPPVRSLAEAGSEVRRDYETSSEAGLREGQENRETSTGGLQQRANPNPNPNPNPKPTPKPKPNPNPNPNLDTSQAGCSSARTHLRC